MKKFFLFLIFLSFISISLYSVDLSLSTEDVKIQRDKKTGYHLYVRQKEGVNSVILTETVKSPDGKADNYAYRAKEWNPVNGDEKRMLDGKFLDSPSAKYSILDSTPEKHKDFGMAFHLYIPETLVYGYPWSRNGEVKIEKGTFISIRTFEKPYADYSGSFLDNSFMFNFKAPSPKPPEKEDVPVLYDDYNKTAVDSFEDIAKENAGQLLYSRGPETLVSDIMKSFEAINPKSRVDVVFAIDATGSMKDDVAILRKNLIPQLEAELLSYGDVRLGLLLYRDYNDNFNYKNLPVKFFDFTDNLDVFTANLNNFRILGREGGDVPEAVYEALYASLNFYNWDPKAEKKIILIGDAEPHPKPRGKIKCTKESVMSQAKAMNITIDTIIIPDN